MRYLILALLMLSNIAVAEDLKTVFEEFKKQFPETAQYFEKDVEGGEGGSIRLIFPIVEIDQVPQDPVTVVDLDKAEQNQTNIKGNPELPSVEVEKVKPDFSFVQYSSEVSKKDSKQLDGLAQVLLLHPEIAKVRIDVYGRDQQIAKKRASRICEYMMERGISSGRCETKSIVDTKEQVLRFFLLKE